MLEQLAPEQWRRRGRGYALCDIDGHPIRTFDEGALAESRRMQWAIPVLVGVRGDDAFWWYRDSSYRCRRGLNWWDIAALSQQGRATGVRVSEGLAPHRRRNPGRTARLIAAHVQERGVADTVRKARERLRPHLRLAESHVWYVLRLPDVRPPSALPDGYDLKLGGEGDIRALGDLPTPVARAEAERRIATGGEFWLLREGDRVVSTAWLFRTWAPATAAPGGSFRVPARHTVIEDVMTAEAYRGRGLAPAAWLALADRLKSDSYARLLSKAATDNAAGRRAFAKAGFTEAAVVHLRRTAGFNKVRVDELADAEVTMMLRSRLG